ncbi:cytochrome P450 716B1-like protein [Tanacetum coccineum]|uniref:Cytochrome P450 716B1-like protein n=1 Tax=Tanacetum coccineum TaxID=301880 RepID=A0ABQ5DNJ7_9ASTR
MAVMVGGYHTTSVLVSFLIRLLATNKPIYTNILQEQEEISKGKSVEEALTWEDLTKMKYTWRVASEMLRMYSPVPMFFRQVVQDIEYEGYLIPKGWQVMWSPCITHWDDGIFQNPTMFDPSRFEKSPPPFSYIPFGGGSRICPGIEFAKMQILAMIHRLVTQFTWELVKKDESFKRDPMQVFDHGLLARFTPIKETSASSKA